MTTLKQLEAKIDAIMAILNIHEDYQPKRAPKLKAAKQRKNNSVKEVATVLATVLRPGETYHYTEITKLVNNSEAGKKLVKPLAEQRTLQICNKLVDTWHMDRIRTGMFCMNSTATLRDVEAA